MLITMLAPIAALVAALAGITGIAWDKRKRGWRRLTVNGWVIAGVAIASFAVSVYQVRQAAIFAANQQAKDAIIRRAAAGEINEAIGDVPRPFKLVVDAERYSYARIAAKMTSAQITESKELAERCRASKFKEYS